MSIVLTRLLLVSLLVLSCSSLKIGFILGGGLSDFGFNYQIFLGIQQFQYENPTVQTQYSTSVAVADCISVATSYMNNGFDVLIFPNLPFAACAQNISLTYPNKKFVVSSAGESYPSIPNLATDFRGGLSEARFILGVLAAKQKHTNKICLAIPKTYPLKQRWLNYVMLGIRHVNNHDSLHIGMTASYNDPATELKVVNHFIEYGCDVVMQHALNTIYVQELVANASLWGMGQQTDMRDYVGESVLSSIVTDWNVMFTHFYEKIVAGTFTNELFLDTLQNGGIAIADYSCEVSKGAKHETNRVIRKILDGKLNILCQPLIQQVFGTNCVVDSALDANYFDGITFYDATL